MKLETNQPIPGEPEDGWVGTEPLIDTEILQLILCRFTGDKVPMHGTCQTRWDRRHPDVECKTLFLQAEGLRYELLDGRLGANEELRAPYRVGEPVATTHLAPGGGQLTL